MSDSASPPLSNNSNGTGWKRLKKWKKNLKVNSYELKIFNQNLFLILVIFLIPLLISGTPYFLPALLATDVAIGFTLPIALLAPDMIYYRLPIFYFLIFNYNLIIGIFYL